MGDGRNKSQWTLREIGSSHLIAKKERKIRRTKKQDFTGIQKEKRHKGWGERKRERDRHSMRERENRGQKIILKNGPKFPKYILNHQAAFLSILNTMTIRSRHIIGKCWK